MVRLLRTTVLFGTAIIALLPSTAFSATATLVKGLEVASAQTESSLLRGADHRRVPEEDATTATGAGAGSREKRGTLGVALNGSGSLVYYYIGVIKKLIELGVLVPGETKMGGVSGGALMAVMTSSGVPPDDLQKTWNSIITGCAANASALNACTADPLAAIKRVVYDPLVTEEAYEKCGHGVVSITYTVLDTKASSFLQGATPTTVDDFTSLEDFKGAALASSFVSCQVGPTPYTIYRGQPAVDGEYTSTFEHICPKGVDRCLKIDCFKIGDKVVDTPKAPALFPPLLAKPWKTAEAEGDWTLPRECTNEIRDYTMVWPSDADIYPGKFNPFPYTVEGWHKLAHSPLVDGKTQADMVNLGMADAQSWYEQEM